MNDQQHKGAEFGQVLPFMPKSAPRRHIQAKRPLPGLETSHLADVLRAREDRLSRLLVERELACETLLDSVMDPLRDAQSVLDGVQSDSANPFREVTSLVTRRLTTAIQGVRSVIGRLQSDGTVGYDFRTDLESIVEAYQESLTIRLCLEPGADNELTFEEGRFLLKLVRALLSSAAPCRETGQFTLLFRRQKGSIRFEIRSYHRPLHRSLSLRHRAGLSRFAAQAARLGGRLLVYSESHHATTVVVLFPLLPLLREERPHARERSSRSCQTAQGTASNRDSLRVRRESVGRPPHGCEDLTQPQHVAHAFDHQTNEEHE